MFHIPVNENLKLAIEHVGEGIFHLLVGTPNDDGKAIAFGGITVDELMILGQRLVDLRNNEQFKEMLLPKKILTLIEQAALDGSLVPLDPPTPVANENQPSSTPVPTTENPKDTNATS